MTTQTDAGPPPAARQDPPDVDAIAQALAAPFVMTEVKFKAQTVSGNRALAVPFVDARVVQDRLDEVLGVMGWQDSYDVLPDGAVVCRLMVRIDRDWITKVDVGGQSEQPDEGDRRKAAFSDALKRAAVKFGIGRYLYRQKPQWVDYDPQKRQFTTPPRLPAAAQPAAPAPAKKQAPQQAKPQPTRLEKMRAFDADCAAWFREVGCKPGDLVKHVAAALRPTFGGDCGEWGDEAWKAAGGVARAFEQGQRPQLDALIERRVEAKGYGPADLPALAAKVGAPSITQLTHEQAAKAAAVLSALPDVQKRKGA